MIGFERSNPDPTLTCVAVCIWAGVPPSVHSRAMMSVHPIRSETAPAQSTAKASPRPKLRLDDQWQRHFVAIAIMMMTLVALWIRFDGLQGWDGTLSVDEARLALAARGVVQTCVP